MLGVFVNVLTVVLGGLLGMLLKKGIPQRLSDIILKGIGLCTIYIGVSGALKGENTIVLILSITIGALIGELLDLDKLLNKGAEKLQSKFNAKNGGSTLAEGFVTASLLFCVGAMTVVGSLQAGLSGDNEMLFTKATLDFISSIVLASALGFGVVLAGGFVLVMQGGIVLLAGLLDPLLTDYVIAEITCVGSVLIIGLGLNLLGVTKLKIMNFLPAIFIPLLLCLFL